MENTCGFNIGDIVRLKSGSPDMVVTKTNEEWIRCRYWSDSQRNFITADFYYETIESVQIQDPGLQLTL